MFKLKIRKITKISGTHYIALPNEWVKNSGLGKSDELSIFLSNDGSLVIRAGGDTHGTE